MADCQIQEQERMADEELSWEVVRRQGNTSVYEKWLPTLQSNFAKFLPALVSSNDSRTNFAAGVGDRGIRGCTSALCFSCSGERRSQHE